MPLLARLKHTLRAQNRGKFKAPWMLANVGYDVVYTIVMIKVFGQYGANGWAYVCYVAVFSALWAWSTFELVGALVDRRPRRAYRFGTLAFVAFIAPDLYLVVATHGVPWQIWLALALYLGATAVAAVVALRQKVRTHRTARPAGKSAAQGADRAAQA